jgi:hypothetical protein
MAISFSGNSKMIKRTAPLFMAALLIVYLSSHTLGQHLPADSDQKTKPRWQELRSNSLTLYKLGKRNEAISLAKMAVEAAGKEYGTEHPESADHKREDSGVGAS